MERSFFLRMKCVLAKRNAGLTCGGYKVGELCCQTAMSTTLYFVILLCIVLKKLTDNNESKNEVKLVDFW